MRGFGNVGVYTFIEVMSDGTWKILRVGETGKMDERIHQYCSLGPMSHPKVFQVCGSSIQVCGSSNAIRAAPHLQVWQGGHPRWQMPSMMEP